MLARFLRVSRSCTAFMALFLSVPYRQNEREEARLDARLPVPRGPLDLLSLVQHKHMHEEVRRQRKHEVW